MAAGAATVAIADDQPVVQISSIAEPSQPAATRYYDIEANKANSMRVLGRYIAEQRANPKEAQHHRDEQATDERAGPHDATITRSARRG